MHYLCDYDLILKMLKALYVPQHGSLLRLDLVDDVTFLIAYATTLNNTRPPRVNVYSRGKENVLF